MFIPLLKEDCNKRINHETMMSTDHTFFLNLFLQDLEGLEVGLFHFFVAVFN